MALYCTACASEAAPKINRELAQMVSHRNVAKQYGLHPSSLYRHQKNCLPRLTKMMEARELRQAKSLTDQLDELEAHTTEILENAKESGDGELALKAIDRRHKQVELHAKLAGEFKENAPNPLTAEERSERTMVLLRKAEIKLIEGAQAPTDAVN